VSASEKFGLSLFGLGGGEESEVFGDVYSGLWLAAAVAAANVVSRDFADLSSGIIIIIVTVLLFDSLVRLGGLWACSVRLMLLPLETDDEVDELDKYDDPFDSELLMIMPRVLPPVLLLSFDLV
jgi:hypothetical protein